MHRINVLTPGFLCHDQLSLPPCRPGDKVPDYVTPCQEGTLEPHIQFRFQTRLRRELALRDPAQHFAREPEPLAPTGGPLLAPENKARDREDRKIAQDRETRFNAMRAVALAQRQERLSRSPSPRAAIVLSESGVLDASLIENRDYELTEVVGPEAQFHLRLVPWGGGCLRPVVAADSSLVLVLGGCSHQGDWLKEVAQPATLQCDVALQSLRQSSAEVETGSPPTLAGGVGESFNEPALARPEHGVVLNALVFFQLFYSLAMRRLIGYGNCSCGSVSFSALEAEKKVFLEHKPRALYPSESSVFSAATFKFGGPHRCKTLGSGIPDRFQAGKWSVLTALGKYASLHGGHVIFWDLGLVVCFPSSSSILIPTGIVRYSFVKWARSGITRWFTNGCREDVEFAVKATKKEYVAWEERRKQQHAEAIEEFPIESELPDDETCIVMPFLGTAPVDTE
ncbi:hypothetical protein B0H17DRAFT_1199496 [Mycena rosella]|uniref:Uncharacterized protein n=1 Tax=Mycena rosella TaxID=1033263 RepID=A0AAD7GGU4_MYCRO|nr:hypothetical protein B0H17DRAFT_1199496 [Mycena rosella]